MSKTFHVNVDPSDIIEEFFSRREISFDDIAPDHFEFEVRPEFFFDRIKFSGVDSPQKWSALGYTNLGLKVLVEGTITPSVTFHDELFNNMLVKGADTSHVEIGGTMTFDIMYTELKGMEVLTEDKVFMIDLSHLIPEARKMF